MRDRRVRIRLKSAVFSDSRFIMSRQDEESPLLGRRADAPHQRGQQFGPTNQSEQLRDESDYYVPPNRGGRRLSIVCLFSVLFLQCFGTNIERQVRHSLTKLCNIKAPDLDKKFMPLIAVGAIILYVLPMLVGLYADTYAGRYTSLFYGITLKLAGTCVGFVISVVTESVKDISPMTGKILLAVYVISLIMMVMGLATVIPPVITFIAQQGDQKFARISSLLRWGALVVVIATSVLQFVIQLRHAIPLPLLNVKAPYYETLLYGITLGSDSLSMAIFLLGKVQYKKQTTEEGQRSWKYLVRVIKTFLFRVKSTYVEDDDVLRSTATRDREQAQRRTLERLKFRRGVLFFGLMSCFAVSLSMSLLMGYLTRIYKCLWTGHTWLPVVGLFKLIPYIVGSVIVGSVYKKFHGRLKPETEANQLKTIGVGFVIGAIALVIAGVMSDVKDIQAVSVFWLIPQYIVMGVSSFIVITSAPVLIYFTSPKGLETFTICLGACLCVLMLVIEFVIGIAIDIKKFSRMDVICYILAGVMVFVLLAIYIPLSRSFLKAGRDINDVIEAEARGETPVTRNESLTRLDEISTDRRAQRRDVPNDPEVDP